MLFNYKVIRINSKAKRIELEAIGYDDSDVEDIPYNCSFRLENLDGIWTDVLSKIEEGSYSEFRGAFLVILGTFHPLYTISTAPEMAWKELADRWDFYMI